MGALFIVGPDPTLEMHLVMLDFRLDSVWEFIPSEPKSFAALVSYEVTSDFRTNIFCW